MTINMTVSLSPDSCLPRPEPGKAGLNYCTMNEALMKPPVRFLLWSASFVFPRINYSLSVLIVIGFSTYLNHIMPDK